MRIYTTIKCDYCGQLGEVELGPQQCSELATSKKIGAFLADVTALFIKRAVEHDKECPKK
jgi:hypothetical protein